MSRAAGTLTFVRKGLAHNWQNIGRTHGRIVIVLAPAGFEKRLEEISEMPLSQRDLATLKRVYQKHGADVLARGSRPSNTRVTPAGSIFTPSSQDIRRFFIARSFDLGSIGQQ